MYKIKLTVDESLALMSYVGLLRFFMMYDKDIYAVSQIIDNNIQMENVLYGSDVVFDVDSSELFLLRTFIISQLIGPLARNDIDKRTFNSILEKIDSFYF